MLGLGLDFFTLPEGSKLACSCFMGAGRGLETPESETEDFVTRHSRNIPNACEHLGSPHPLPSPRAVSVQGVQWVCVTAQEHWPGGWGAGGDLALLL